jgi:hypothetical protein
MGAAGEPQPRRRAAHARAVAARDRADEALSRDASYFLREPGES